MSECAKPETLWEVLPFGTFVLEINIDVVEVDQLLKVCLDRTEELVVAACNSEVES